MAIFSDWRTDDTLTDREKELAERMGLLKPATLEASLSAYFGKRGMEKGCNELSLAEALDRFAAKAWGKNKKLLAAIAVALRGNDERHSIVLKQTKRGRSEKFDPSNESFYRVLDWYDWVAEAELASEKTEAVIAEICEREGVSRATVFAGLKEAGEYLALFNKLGLKSPLADRPAKGRNH